MKYKDKIRHVEGLLKKLTVNEAEFAALLATHAELHDYIRGWSADRERATVVKILMGLGFTAPAMTCPLSECSGSWRMRVSLARSLYLEPDLLLLDGSTDHMDLDEIIWLSDYLQSWKGCVVIVSNNIGVLNDVCNNILAIEFQKLVHYIGDYDSYRRAYDDKLREDEKAWDKKLHEVREKGDKKKLEGHIAKVVTRPSPKICKSLIEFGNAEKLRKNIIFMDNVCFGYTPDKPVLSNVTLGIDSDTRIVLVGPNGSGKSTLAKLMAKEIVPTSGNILFNDCARIGYYNQHFEAKLPLGRTPIEYLCSMIPDNLVRNCDKAQSVHMFLGKVRLETFARNKLIGELSGGQRASVAIVELIFMRPDCLILDELTNRDFLPIDATQFYCSSP